MFYMPTRIFFADNALARAEAHLICLGKKAMIVTGKSSALKSGAQDAVTALLAKASIPWHVFDEVGENPSLDMIVRGISAFALNDCDFLIAIGGGSPIDAAKAISLVAANKIDITDIYNTSLYKKKIPLAAIPTTSGSGTEATPFAVLTDPVSGKKAGFGSELAFPDLSILEPAFTLSLSHRVTLNTGIDALSHLLEGIYSNKRNPLMYPIIFNGVRTIYENLPRLLADLSDLDARTHLMRASLYGGMVIAHASTTLQHSIGYPLTTVYGVPHGLANGIVMRSIMELYYPAVQKELDALFSSMGISRDQFYNWLEALSISIDIRISDGFINERIPEVLASRNMANNPFEISAEEIRSIYRQLQEGD